MRLMLLPVSEKRPRKPKEARPSAISAAGPPGIRRGPEAPWRGQGVEPPGAQPMSADWGEAVIDVAARSIRVLTRSRPARHRIAAAHIAALLPISLDAISCFDEAR